MGEFTSQIAIVFGVLAACFAGPGAALFVLIRRKAKARQSRRSPIGIALLRGPGHSLREQLDEVHNDLTGDLMLLMAVTLLALATFLAQSHLRGLPQTAHLAPVYALAAIAFIAYILRKLLKAGTRLDHLKASYDAEAAIVALPGGFVDRTGRGRVRVFSGKELAGLLKSRGTQPLTAQDVQRIAHQVEQRCRTVAPLYAQEPKAG
jgi:hypothetical protein